MSEGQSLNSNTTLSLPSHRQLRSLVSTTVDKETDRSGYRARDPQHGSPMRSPHDQRVDNLHRYLQLIGISFDAISGHCDCFRRLSG